MASMLQWRQALKSPQSWAAGNIRSGSVAKVEANIADALKRLADPRWDGLRSTVEGQAFEAEVHVWAAQSLFAVQTAAGEKKAGGVVRYMKSQTSFYESYTRRQDSAGAERCKNSMAKYLAEHEADLAGASASQREQLAQDLANVGLPMPELPVVPTPEATPVAQASPAVPQAKAIPQVATAAPPAVPQASVASVQAPPAAAPAPVPVRVHAVATTAATAAPAAGAPAPPRAIAHATARLPRAVAHAQPPSPERLHATVTAATATTATTTPAVARPHAAVSGVVVVRTTPVTAADSAMPVAVAQPLDSEPPRAVARVKAKPAQ